MLVVWLLHSSLLPQIAVAFPTCELALLGQYYCVNDLREFQPLPNPHDIADFELAFPEVYYGQGLSQTEGLYTI